MDDVFDIGLPLLVFLVALTWIVLHYVTKWKHAAKITPEDENLLDEMYNLARRLEDRVQTVERIVAADHPEFRAGLSGPAPDRFPTVAAPTRPYQTDRRN